MKLVSYNKQGNEQLAFCIGDNLYDTNTANQQLPSTMKELLNNWEAIEKLAKEVYQLLKNSSDVKPSASFTTAEILAPVPQPASCRDGYAFRQHVAAARRNRRLRPQPALVSRGWTSAAQLHQLLGPYSQPHPAGARSVDHDDRRRHALCALIHARCPQPRVHQDRRLSCLHGGFAHRHP